MEFCPIKTEDGTISLYNFKVKDVYHSKIGAYTEALHKYTIPSGLQEFVKHHNEVKILDICFGLGYNSKVAVSEIFKINPDCKVTINAIEIDKKVLSLSCIFPAENEQDFIEQKFFTAINKQIDVNKVLEDYIKEIEEYSPDLDEILPSGYKSIQVPEIKLLLHNIYYRTVSTRNIRSREASHINDLLTINIYTDEARKIINQIDTEHDFIFLDPFTPSKAPQLWSVEFFKKLYVLLKETGNLTTYSSASPVRAGMPEAGFFIGRTEPLGKRTSGTIAYKKKELLKNLLTEYEIGLLKTKAGIPYYDEDLSSTSEEIIQKRELMQKNSDRLSSGKYFRSLNFKCN